MKHLIIEPPNAGEDARSYWSEFGNIRSSVMITDAAESILAVNPAFTKITGYGQAEVIGLTPRVINSGIQDKSFYEHMWASLIETGCWHGEIWDRRKDGRPYLGWLSVGAVYDQASRVKNYVAIFSDVTELKPTEAQIRLLSTRNASTGMSIQRPMEYRRNVERPVVFRLTAGKSNSPQGERLGTGLSMKRASGWV
jgi:PAS domain S-box-containing protein